MKRWEKLYPDRKRVMPGGRVYWELTKAEIERATTAPMWLRMLLIGSPFLGIAVAAIIRHYFIQ